MQKVQREQTECVRIAWNPQKGLHLKEMNIYIF